MPQQRREIGQSTSVCVLFCAEWTFGDFENPDWIARRSRLPDRDFGFGAGVVGGEDALPQRWFAHAVCRSWPCVPVGITVTAGSGAGVWGSIMLPHDLDGVLACEVATCYPYITG